MTQKRVVVDVSDDRHHRYFFAARLERRSMHDILTELLDAWSDGVLRAASLADVVAASKETEG